MVVVRRALAVLLVVGCAPPLSSGSDVPVDAPASSSPDAPVALDAPELPSDVPPDAPDVAVGPRVVLGEGESSFRPISDGETLGLVRGCQGAQHVWVALRAEELATGPMITALSLSRTRDGALVSEDLLVRYAFAPTADPAVVERLGITLVVPDPSAALGEELVLHGRLEDSEGSVVEDARMVRIDWAAPACP